MEVMEIDPGIARILADGEQILANKMKILELEKAEQLKILELKREVVKKKIYAAIGAIDPAVLQYIQINEELLERMTIPVDVAIPGFAPIKMEFDLYLPGINLPEITWGRVCYRMVDIDEDGIDSAELLVPFWDFGHGDKAQDFSVALVYAREQWELMQWEEMKGKLLKLQAAQARGNRDEMQVEEGMVLGSIEKFNYEVYGGYEKNCAGAWDELTVLLREVVMMEADRVVRELMEGERDGL